MKDALRLAGATPHREDYLFFGPESGPGDLSTQGGEAQGEKEFQVRGRLCCGTLRAQLKGLHVPDCLVHLGSV
jgi:hypothetical protein